MVKLSLYVITMNEEERLPRTLEAARAIADEIVIVDSGSTDGTEAVAQRYGARFIHNDWTSFGHQVSVAEKLCHNDWVLRLDADEVLSPELAREIAEIKKNPDCDGYRIRISDVYPGKPLPIRWARHYKLIRMYHRKKFSMLGHLDHDDVDPIVAHPKVRTLRGLVHHYSYLTLYQFWAKQNRATDTQIAMLIKAGKRYSPWRMVGTTTLTFLKYYILGRHFLYGWWGFINCANIAMVRFLKFAKWYEYEQLEKTGEQWRYRKGKS